jgi:hypothetical protein
MTAVYDQLTRTLSTLLFRTILVGSVLITLRFIYEGAYVVAGMLVLTLTFLVYLMFGEARWLE